MILLKQICTELQEGQEKMRNMVTYVIGRVPEECISHTHEERLSEFLVTATIPTEAFHSEILTSCLSNIFLDSH